MIERQEVVTNPDPFRAYDSYLDLTTVDSLVFLSQEERRRYARYSLLFSLAHSYSDAFEQGVLPKKGDKDPIDSPRDYGESPMVAKIIRDAVISGEVLWPDTMPEPVQEVLDESHLASAVMQNELMTGLLGDAWFHLYPKRADKWRIEILRAERVVVQVFDREMKHVIVWSERAPIKDAKGQTVRVVWVLEYRLTPNAAGTDNICEISETLWTVNSRFRRPANSGPSAPFDFEPLTLLRDLQLRPEEVDQAVSDMTAAGRPANVADAAAGIDRWRPLAANGKPLDFIPLVHMPNRPSGRLHGLADLHDALHALKDLGPVNQRVMSGTKLLALPPMSVEDSGGNFSDFKSKSTVGATGEKTVTKRKYAPGMILRGKVTMVDTSKMFDALMAAKSDLYKTIFAVCQTPEIAFGPSEIRVPSGTALRIVLQPLISLATGKRIERSDKYRLLLKFVYKVTGQAYPTKRAEKPSVAFGDLLAWASDRAKYLLLAQAQKVISVQETRDHLAKAEILEPELLDPNFQPEPALSLTDALGRGGNAPEDSTPGGPEVEEDGDSQGLDT